MLYNFALLLLLFLSQSCLYMPVWFTHKLWFIKSFLYLLLCYIIVIFSMSYCLYLSMHAVKKLFSGIRNLSICPKKPSFCGKNLSFWKLNLLKNLLFHKVELTACKLNGLLNAIIDSKRNAQMISHLPGRDSYWHPLRIALDVFVFYVSTVNGPTSITWLGVLKM